VVKHSRPPAETSQEAVGQPGFQAIGKAIALDGGAIRKNSEPPGGLLRLKKKDKAAMPCPSLLLLGNEARQQAGQ